MGQYHMIVNVDKKEYLRSNGGLKLLEWGYLENPMNLTLLDNLTKNWKGDRVYVVGDYGNSKDVYSYECSKIFSGLEKEFELCDKDGNINNSIYNLAYDKFKEIDLKGNLKIASSLFKVQNNSLISDEIEVPLTNISKYTVSVDNGTVVNSSGNPQNTFNAGEKFRIKADVSGSITSNVTVTASYVTEYVTIYRRADKADSQDVVSPYIVSINNNLSKNLKLTYENVVEFSKVDATTGSELPGATLVIRDSSGKEVESWVSTNEIHRVKLSPGTYTLEETIAPDGYILSKEKVKFTVKEDGTCDKVVMKNELVKVPETSSNISSLILVISILVGIFGSYLVYRNFEYNSYY